MVGDFTVAVHVGASPRILRKVLSMRGRGKSQ